MGAAPTSGPVVPSASFSAEDDRTLHALELDDAYRVERVLSDGPSSRTELVTLDGLGPFVRKRIPRELANPGAWSVLMGVDEPLLPQVQNIYMMPDALVVVCAYVKGPTLQARVQAKGPLAPHDAVDVLVQVAHAADVLHEHGVIHRDITPSNVILATDGAHLIDLGIARVRTGEAPHDTTRLGTWGFASPEQYGFAQTDARSDVYSLGRLLAYMLTGVRPDEPGFEAALADPARVPGALRGVVAHACEFEPSSRPQSAADLAVEARSSLAITDEEAPGRTARAHVEGPGTAAPAEKSAAPPARRLLEAVWGRVARLVGSWRVWVSLVALVWGVVVSIIGLNAGFFPATPPSGVPMTLFYLLSGVVIAATWGVLPTWEAIRSLFHLGSYERRQGRIPRLLKRLALAFAGGFALVVVLAFVAAIADEVIAAF